MLKAEYGDVVGTGFLIGFWAASFSSIIGVWNGVSLMFADFWGNMRKKESGHPDTRVGGKYFRFYVLWLTFPPMLAVHAGQADRADPRFTASWDRCSCRSWH